MIRARPYNAVTYRDIVETSSRFRTCDSFLQHAKRCLFEMEITNSQLHLHTHTHTHTHTHIYIYIYLASHVRVRSSFKVH